MLGTTGEISDKNEGHVIRIGEKWPDNLTDISVYQRIELVSDELGYLAAEISKLGVET